VVNFHEQKNGGYHSKEIMSKEKEKVLNWLRHNEHRISKLAISKEVGISNTQLSKAIKGQANGNGRVETIPDKHLPKLLEIIKDMKY
jgi:hypothetical protein